MPTNSNPPRTYLNEGEMGVRLAELRYKINGHKTRGDGGDYYTTHFISPEEEYGFKIGYAKAAQYNKDLALLIVRAVRDSNTPLTTDQRVIIAQISKSIKSNGADLVLPENPFELITPETQKPSCIGNCNCNEPN